MIPLKCHHSTFPFLSEAKVEVGGTLADVGEILKNFLKQVGVLKWKCTIVGVEEVFKSKFARG